MEGLAAGASNRFAVVQFAVTALFTLIIRPKKFQGGKQATERAYPEPLAIASMSTIREVHMLPGLTRETQPLRGQRLGNSSWGTLEGNTHRTGK